MCVPKYNRVKFKKKRTFYCYCNNCIIIIFRMNSLQTKMKKAQSLKSPSVDQLLSVQVSYFAYDS